MPLLTQPIREYNQCHDPKDGKFCSGAGRQWTRTAADSFLRQVQPAIERYGYRAKIVGGVAKRGTSAHDLDVLLTPTREDFDFEALSQALPGRGQLTYEASTEIYELRLDDGHIVDFFFDEER